MKEFLCRRPFVIVLAALLGLSACAGVAPGSAQKDVVEIAPGVAVALPQSPELNRSVEAVQLVTIKSGDQTFLMESRLSAANGRFQLVGLDPLGRRVITATWSKEKLEFVTAPWVPENFRVKNLFADMILIYWPHRIGAAMLERAGAALVSKETNRSVRKNGEEIIHIVYSPSQTGVWNGHVRYQNFGWRYVIDIRSTENLR